MDAPVPRRLADPGKRQGDVFPGHPDPCGFVSGVRLGGESQQIRAEAQTGFQLRGLPVRLGSRSIQAHPREVGSSELLNQLPSIQDSLLSATAHVLDRPAHSNRKRCLLDVCT